ncbi:hypothetical protein LINPERHAP1_LOCUS28971, partial [Linum perenne]
IEASKKRTRGATTCKEVWWLPDGDKIKISINSECQPIGKNAPKLSSFLGSLSRKSIYAPLHYTDWRLMPQQYKDSMWDLIEGKFEVDLLAKCNIMNSLSKKWKDFKANVKVAWVKENIRDERRLAAPGNEEPSRADVYIATHVRRDGKPLNDEVAGYIEKMKELKTRLPTTGDDHGPNDVYAQVLGADKPGSTRTYGLGSMKGVKNSRMLMVKQALEAKKSAEDEVKSVREEISELRKEQTKIFALFQKTNPDINVDDIVSSPLRDDIDLNHNFNEGGSNQVN